MDQKIDTTCEHIKLRLITAAVGLQQCTKTAANVIPIPDGRVVAIGTPAHLTALLPGAAHLASQSQAAQPSDLPRLPTPHEELRARWKCEDCNGTGEVGELIDQGYFQPPERARCSNCDGAGQVSIAAFTDDQMADYARTAVAAHLAGKSQAQQPADALRPAVQQMVRALANGEWADLLITDPDAAELEAQIYALIEKAQLVGKSQATNARAEPVPNKTGAIHDLADSIMEELKDRKGVLDDIDDEVLDEICGALSDTIAKSSLARLAAPTAQEVTQQAAKAETAEQALTEMEARKDAAYLERNQVVAALAKCFPSGVVRTAIEGWSEDWHGCVYIDLPTGQASWHFHDSQAYLFNGLPPYAGKWDGHTTEEKYERISRLAPTTSTVSAPTVKPALPSGEQVFELATPYFAWNASSWHKATQGTVGMPQLLEYTRAAIEKFAAPSSTEGTQAAPEEVRNQALEEAAEIVDSAHAKQHWSSWHLFKPMADEIRALKRTSTDQADTDTGSAA